LSDNSNYIFDNLRQFKISAQIFEFFIDKNPKR